MAQPSGFSAPLSASSAHPCSSSFAQVYPTEQEALYPPLTYLRAVKTEKERYEILTKIEGILATFGAYFGTFEGYFGFGCSLGGMETLVATVEPVFP